MQIKVKHKKIGDRNSAFIIAEIGINHNGKASLAVRLVNEAAKAGVDAVKVQVVDPQESYVKMSKSYEIFKHTQLSLNTLKRLKKIAEKKGLVFFATAGDISSLDKIVELKVPLIKISSGGMTNTLLLRKAAKTRLPVIVSTGMSYLTEVKEAVAELEKYGAKHIMLLHCVSQYPAKYNGINLNAIKTLEAAFKYPVGYSDHTEGNLACFAAVSLGAKVIEKHFTLDKSYKGPDHCFSADPKQLKELVKQIRGIEKIMGSHVKRPTREEKKSREKARRFLVFTKKLGKGTLLEADSVGIKRIVKGKGLAPKYYDRIIGKRIISNVRRDQPVRLNLFEKGGL